MNNGPSTTIRIIGGNKNHSSRSITMYTRFKEELNKQIRNDQQFQEHLRDLQKKKKEIEGTRGFRRIKVIRIEVCVFVREGARK